MKALFDHKPTFIWPLDRKNLHKLEVDNEGCQAGFVLWRDEDHEVILNLTFDRLFHVVYTNVLHQLQAGADDHLHELWEMLRHKRMAEILTRFNR